MNIDLHQQSHLSSVTRNPENLDIFYYTSFGNFYLSVNYSSLIRNLVSLLILRDYLPFFDSISLIGTYYYYINYYKFGFGKLCLLIISLIN